MNWRFWVSVTVVIVAVGAAVGSKVYAERRQQRAYQAVYDHGARVGHELGWCDALDMVASVESGRALTAELDRLGAYEACAAFRREHGPGTPETIPVER